MLLGDIEFDSSRY